MKEIDLGMIESCSFGDKELLAISGKYRMLNQGKPLEFHVKINENGKLVLESSCLTKLSNTRGNDDKNKS